MNADKHDPIFDSLDRLAGLADADHVGDRMPDIRRRAREARRRKVAGAGVAAAAVLAAGIGLSQALPRKSEPQPLPTPDNLRQTITIDAEGTYADLVRVRVTVEGRASAYADPVTAEAVPAGPLYYRVIVDGEVVKETEASEVTCEQGGEVSSYSERFPRQADRAVAAYVSGPGEHVVVVHAPYCADGELVDEPAQVTVTTEVGEPVVEAEDVVDLDADGLEETVQIVSPAVGEVGAWSLEVSWGSGSGSGGGAGQPLPETSEWSLAAPQDLDGDGRLELIVTGGGGDSSAWQVYRVGEDRSLVAVSTVNQSGADEPLAYGVSEVTPQNETWRIALLPEGFYSFRAREASPSRPATVDVRRWVLQGDTLTLQDETTPGCWGADLALTLGGC